MSILDEMLAVREKFETKDRQNAINVMVWLLYYEVSFRAADDDMFILFKTENDLSAFCVSSEVSVSAMKWLISEMKAEGLVVSETMPIVLTPLGIEKFCARKQEKATG